MHWTVRSGYSHQETYAKNIIEIEKSELPKTAYDYDWSWYDLPIEDPAEYGKDTKIIVEFYAEFDIPEYDEPIAKICKWESDLWYETYEEGW